MQHITAADTTFREYGDGSFIFLNDLNAFENGDVVDAAALKASGLIKKELDGIKVLGNGELTKKLTVKVNAYSEAAKAKIEAAGGKAEVV